MDETHSEPREARAKGESKTIEINIACPNCGADDCTQIMINLQEEDTVQFFSCRRCEWKWWEHEGDTINLDEVLTLASRKPPR